MKQLGFIRVLPSVVTDLSPSSAVLNVFFPVIHSLCSISPPHYLHNLDLKILRFNGGHVGHSDVPDEMQSTSEIL